MIVSSLTDLSTLGQWHNSTTSLLSSSSERASACLCSSLKRSVLVRPRSAGALAFFVLLPHLSFFSTLIWHGVITIRLQNAKPFQRDSVAIVRIGVIRRFSVCPWTQNIPGPGFSAARSPTRRTCRSKNRSVWPSVSTGIFSWMNGFCWD